VVWASCSSSPSLNCGPCQIISIYCHSPGRRTASWWGDDAIDVCASPLVGVDAVHVGIDDLDLVLTQQRDATVAPVRSVPLDVLGNAELDMDLCVAVLFVARPVTITRLKRELVVNQYVGVTWYIAGLLAGLDLLGVVWVIGICRSVAVWPVLALFPDSPFAVVVRHGTWTVDFDR